MPGDTDATPNNDAVQHHNNGDAHQSDLFTDDRKNEIRMGFGQEKKFLVAMPKSRPHDPAGSERHLGMNHLVPLVGSIGPGI